MAAGPRGLLKPVTKLIVGLSVQSPFGNERFSYFVLRSPGVLSAANTALGASTYSEGVTHATRGRRSHSVWPLVLTVLALIVVAILSLLPTLVHGTVLAPFDFLSLFGLGHQSGVIPFNTVDSDLVQQDVPWLALAWTQVHHGHLPLWNPYDGLGMPLGLDFITASFSVPTLLSYLAPIQLQLLVSVVTKMVIAGTGVLFLGRVLGLGYLAAAFAGMIFELCGAFTVWLGWSQTGVMAWLGWIVGATLLILLGRRRIQSIILFAVTFALSVYGGHPESNVITTVAVAAIVLVILARRTLRLDGSHRVAQPLLDLCVGTLCALGLSAPLWLPGVQLTTQAVRYDSGGSSILPLSDLGNFIFNGYNGLPISTSHYFGAGNYYEVTAYLGICVLGLGSLALFTYWRRAEIQALAVMAFVMSVIVFFPPMFNFLGLVPHATGINWHRDLIPISLGCAVFAGFGLEIIMKEGMTRQVQRRMLVVFGSALVILLAVGVTSGFGSQELSARDAAIRARSFIWPGVQTVLGLSVAITWILARRLKERGSGAAHRRGAKNHRLLLGAGALVLGLSGVGFLVCAGGPLFSPGERYFPVTPADAALQRAVGSATVGFGQCPSVTGYADLGILPNANIGYRVHEISFYETAVAPVSYYQSWAEATRKPLVTSADGVFCPAITSVELARRYGIGFILEPQGKRGPPGTVARGAVGNEGLYEVLDTGPATLARVATFGSTEGGGRVIPVTHPDTAEWKMVTNSTRASVLFVRETDMDGWTASVSGEPAVIHRWDSVMMEIRVPPGRHVVELSYWPERFSVGLVMAALTIFGLMVASVISVLRKS